MRPSSRAGTRPVALDVLMAALRRSLPSAYEPVERRLAITLYRELARGRPVEPARLAQALGMTGAGVRALLARRVWNLVDTDIGGAIHGFAGLSIRPTGHRFVIEGRELYTWCAWDGLFIPAVLGVRAHLASRCPLTGREIEIAVSPIQVERVEPADAVLSMVVPTPSLFRDTRAKTISNFCHFVHFLASVTAAASWTADRRGTTWLGIDDGFALGQVLNSRWGVGAPDAWNRTPASPVDGMRR